MSAHLLGILLTSTVKVSLIVTLGLCAAALARRRSAALRHWILAIAILCAALLPAFELAVPSWRLPVASWSQATAGSSLTLTSDGPPAAGELVPAVGPAPSRGLAARVLALPAFAAVAVWAAGATAGFAILLGGLWRLRRLARPAAVPDDWRVARLAARAAAIHGIRRPVLVLRSTHPALVVTWGILRPRILLPSGADEWSADRMRVVLSHELAHVKRGDWWVQMVAALLRCIYWFDPLLWIMCRQLRHESERASDDLVLSAGVNGADYATHLLAVAREAVRMRHHWMPATAIARPSTLEGRIRAMLNHTINRRPPGRSTQYATAIAGVLATLAIAGAALSAADVADAQDQAAWTTYVRETQEGLRVLAEETRGPREPVVAPPAASAQSAAQAPNSIAGTVYDQLGGLLPGTTISLTQIGSGGTYQTVTDHSGSFTFRDLPPGDYALEARLAGFSTVRTAVSVTRDATARRNISLPLGSLQETITVTGERGGSPQSDAGPARRLTVLKGPRTIPEPRPATFAFAGGIGGNIKAPRKLVSVNPIYPAEMQATGKSGVVVLTGRIGIDGYMSDLRPVDGLDVDPALIASAMAAAQQWEFDPTLLNGVPVEANLTISVHYTLQ